MAVRGVFASDTHIQGGRRGDFASALLRIEPDGSAPLLALTSGMESADASDTIIHWFEETHMTGRGQVTTGGGVAAGITQLALLDTSMFIPGNIALLEATGEHVFIAGVNGNILTIERGFAGSSAQTIANSAFIQRIGTAFEEGSQRPTGQAQLGYPRFNYMQIFRNAWDVTGTARKVDYYTGDIVAKNKADCMRFHGEDIERSLWFGRKAIGIRNGKPFRTMDGVLNQITTNVTSQSGSVTLVQLMNHVRDVFSKNIKGKPNERIAFCGNSVVTVINELVLKQSVYNIEAGVTEFGMKVMRWITPFGTINLMRHPLFVESPLWTKNLYLLHPGAIRMRWLRRTIDEAYDSDGRRAGIDADYGVMTSECSVEYKAEATGGQFTGIDTSGTKLT